MIRGRCPICGTSYEIPGIDALPSFPFCSDRCRLIDLGRWIDGDYQIPGTTGTAPGPSEAAPGGDESPED